MKNLETISNWGLMRVIGAKAPEELVNWTGKDFEMAEGNWKRE